jgi:hypothetical protein
MSQVKFLVFVTLCLTHATLAMQPAIAQEGPVHSANNQMWPAGRFSLFESLKAHGVPTGALRDMRAIGTNLFFLIESDSGGRTRVARTDLAGHIQLVVDLGANDVIDWSVDADRSVIVDLESADGKLRELRRYDDTGGEERESRVPRDGYATAALRRAPVRMTRSGAIVRVEGGRQVTVGRFPLKHLNRFDTACLALPSQRAAIVDQVDASITIVDLRTGSAQIKALSDPELTRVRNKYSTPSGGSNVLLIQAATSDADGNLYCMLTGYRPALEGAPILILNESADVRKVLRTPTLSGESGPMIPAAIAVANKELFVADRSGAVSSFYLSLIH